MKSEPQHHELSVTPSGEYRMDELCTAFEQAWRSGNRKPIGDWLLRVPEPERPRLLHELILVEVELRRAAGDSPQAGEYQQRFPEYAKVVENAFDETTAHRQSNPFEMATVIAEIGQDTSAGDFSTAGLVDASEPLPEKIGRYPIRGVLGKGAFGRVYLGVDSRLDRQVAIKVALASQFKTPAGRERFLLEARNAAQLDHPGIVRVYDVEENGDLLFIVQQLIDGRNLAASRLDEPWPLNRVADCMSEVARALAVAHQRGIFHCDLKPANILIDREGHPHVADFGLAIDETTQRTRRGELAGTPRYMSPEQVRGEANRLDGRSDIWSLGVILYELATGRPPFDGANRDEVFDEILNRDPKPPRMIDDKIPAAFELIILKCLSKSVADRYSTASEVARKLQMLGPPRQRAWWIAAAVAAIAIIAGILWRPSDKTQSGGEPSRMTATDTEPSDSHIIKNGEPSRTTATDAKPSDLHIMKISIASNDCQWMNLYDKDAGSILGFGRDSSRRWPTAQHMNNAHASGAGALRRGGRGRVMGEADDSRDMNKALYDKAEILFAYLRKRIDSGLSSPPHPELDQFLRAPTEEQILLFAEVRRGGPPQQPESFIVDKIKFYLAVWKQIREMWPDEDSRNEERIRNSDLFSALHDFHCDFFRDSRPIFDVILENPTPNDIVVHSALIGMKNITVTILGNQGAPAAGGGSGERPNVLKISAIYDWSLTSLNDPQFNSWVSTVSPGHSGTYKHELEPSRLELDPPLVIEGKGAARCRIRIMNGYHWPCEIRMSFVHGERYQVSSQWYRF